MTLRMLGTRVAVADLRTAQPAPKQADSHYLSPEHKRWRALVIARAGGACQKCGRRDGRMFADHIIEIKDDPSRALDPANGQCLCASCHTFKTNREREKRHM